MESIIKTNKRKQIGKAVIITIITIFAIILFTLVVMYFLRRSRVGRSWYYRVEGKYHVMYHCQEYIEVDRNKYSVFTDGTFSVRSDEYLTSGEPVFIDYFLPTILYGRIRIYDDNVFPDFISLSYSWDGGRVYLKRKNKS